MQRSRKTEVWLDPGVQPRSSAISPSTPGSALSAWLPIQAGTAQWLHPGCFHLSSSKRPELMVVAQLGSCAHPEPATELRGCKLLLVRPGSHAHPGMANPTEPLSRGWREGVPRGYPDATMGKQHLSTSLPQAFMAHLSGVAAASPPTPTPPCPVSETLTPCASPQLRDHAEVLGREV